MRITAITRYKHAELFAILKRLQWSQAELASRSGLPIYVINRIINLTKRPTQEHANAIQKAFGEVGEYFDALEQWPETFVGLQRGTHKEETMDVPMERLLGCREAMMLPAPESTRDPELEALLERGMEDLSEKERRIIEGRYFDGKSHEDLGREFQCTRSSISAVEAQALRKLRKPRHLRRLADYRSLKGFGVNIEVEPPTAPPSIQCCGVDRWNDQCGNPADTTTTLVGEQCNPYSETPVEIPVCWSCNRRITPAVEDERTHVEKLYQFRERMKEAGLLDEYLFPPKELQP